MCVSHELFFCVMKTLTAFVVAIKPLIFEKKPTHHTIPKKFVLLRLHPLGVIFKLKIQHTLEATQKFSTSSCLEGKLQCIENLVRIYDGYTVPIHGHVRMY